MGLGIAGLKRLTRNAVHASFLDEAGKAKLLARLTKEWREWEQR